MRTLGQGLAIAVLLAATGCGPAEDVGRAQMGVRLALDPALVNSLTVFVLGAGGGSCTDIYDGSVDPFRPGADLVAMETVPLDGTSATVHIGTIPTGDRLFYVEAYASADGTGSSAGVLGTGCARAKVKAGKTASVEISSVCKRDVTGLCVDG